jgi:serine/threonine protein kinase
MGCGGSKDKTLEGASRKEQRKKSPSGHSHSQAQPQEETIPDPGLWSTHKAIKSLGKGGTGETWLYQNRLTGEEVAIKLMMRPLPKIIEPNIQREIRVRTLFEKLSGHLLYKSSKNVLFLPGTICRLDKPGKVASQCPRSWVNSHKFTMAMLPGISSGFP